MVRLAVWAAVLLVAGAVGLGTLLLRPGTSAVSIFDHDVTVSCGGAVGLDEDACRTWGDAILAEGSPTTTFEAEDIVRLRLDRSLLGFGGTCYAEWFLGRYPDDVAWSEEVTCRDA